MIFGCDNIHFWENIMWPPPSSTNLAEMSIQGGKLDTWILIKTDTLKFLPFEDSKITKHLLQFTKKLESQPSNEPTVPLK